MAATSLRRCRRCVEMRQSSVMRCAGSTDRRRSSPQKAEHLSRSSIERLAVDLEGSLSAWLAVGDATWRSFRAAARSSACRWRPRLLVPEPAQPATPAGARRRTPRTACAIAAHRASTAMSSGRPSRMTVAAVSGHGHDLERHLGQHRERAPAARRGRGTGRSR